METTTTIPAPVPSVLVATYKASTIRYCELMEWLNTSRSQISGFRNPFHSTYIPFGATQEEYVTGALLAAQTHLDEMRDKMIEANHLIREIAYLESKGARQALQDFDNSLSDWYTANKNS